MEDKMPAGAFGRATNYGWGGRFINHSDVKDDPCDLTRAIYMWFLSWPYVEFYMINYLGSLI